jgi:hypothetical protein
MMAVTADGATEVDEAEVRAAVDAVLDARGGAS